MSKVKFAVLGCGRIGLKHIKFINDNKDAELVAVIDKNINKIKINNNNKFTNIDDFLKSNLEVDIINVSTPNGQHAKNALSILESNKNVLIEKPMALKKEDAVKIINKSIIKNKKVFVVMQNRYSPVLNFLKNLVNNNKLGEIYFVSINCFWNRNDNYFNNHEWHGDINNDGGVLFTQFSHFIDAIYWIFGDFKNITSNLKKFKKIQNIEFEDTGTIKFELLSKTICSLNFSISAFEKHFESSISVISEKGNIKIEGQYLDKLTICDIEEKPNFFKETRNIPKYYENYDNNEINHALVIQNAIDVLNYNSEIKTNALDGMKVIEIIQKIYEEGRKK